MNTINEFSASISDDKWADITSVCFDNENITLFLSIRNNAILFGEYSLTCFDVIHFKLLDSTIEFLEIEEKCPEISAYATDRKTFVIWGDNIEWPIVLGSIFQAFGDLPNIIDPKYMKETLKFKDYRLPVIIPTEREAEFIELTNRIGIKTYLLNEIKGKLNVSLLKMNLQSFIIAKDFRIQQLK